MVSNQCRLFGRIGYYEMSEDSYFEIDEGHDWIICENLLKNRLLSKNNNINFNEIKVVLTDVDGVLTDAGMYYAESGEELKKFNTNDGMGFELLRNAGYKTGIITSENTSIVERRAKKLKCDYLYQGIKNKLEIVKEIAGLENISLSQIAYIGDDLNDLNALENVGYSACPANANETIKNTVHKRLFKSGGEGAFREFAHTILSKSL